MKHLAVFLLAATFAATATASEQGFRNPVIPGFHPDPSVCRVGDDYYLVTSTFKYFPGVPIFHSRDLSHWEQIGNVLDRESQLPLQVASSGGGIYAPTLRWHDGLFYMVTTNVTGGGNFFVTAQDPAGPWSEPVWLSGQPGIDPTLFWEGGKCYSLSNEGGICINEIDVTTGQALSERRKIWDGTGGRYAEAPHLYKKDGWFYLMIAEGGTEVGHGETIARSRNIYGPYESAPCNPILSNWFKREQNDIRGTGHADLVQAPDGSWWMVFLAYRRQTLENHCLGRETCLAPVVWPKGGWPTVYDGKPIEEQMKCATLPELWPDGSPADGKPSGLYAKDSSGEWVPSRQLRWGSFGPEWLWINNPVPGNYEWTPEGLLLHGTDITLDRGGISPTLVGVRQESLSDEPGTQVSFSGRAPKGARAGLSVYMDSYGHCDLSLVKCGLGRCRVIAEYTGAEMKHVLGSVAVGRRALKGGVKLHITSSREGYSFGCTDAKGRFTDLGFIDCRLLSTETIGGFTGIVFGMFAERCDAVFSRFDL